MAEILVVDDELSLRKSFQKFLTDEGHRVDTAATFEEAREAVQRRDYDVVVCDILLGNRNGIDLLALVRRRAPRTPVVMITGHPTVGTASDSVRLGAFDYLPKPVQKTDLLRVLARAVQHKALATERDELMARLEAIVSSVDEGLLAVDAAGAIRHANAAAGRILGVDPAELAGQRLGELAAGRFQPAETAVQFALKTGGRAGEVRLEFPNPAGEPRVVTCSATPLVSPPGGSPEALLVLRDITRLSVLERELRERFRFRNIIGRSPLMQEIYQLLEDAADTDSTVLILGETGTGKDLVAQALHHESRRAAGPFVKVNCAALSENLLESELFGHVRGAFTGAIRDRVGRFQLAKGGTIFLDEIGDISPAMQTKLLRVLQDRTFERVGDSRPLTADVRIVAASNQDLAAKMKRGEFREDLYYRLNVLRIHMPPLRARKEDIPLLVEHFREGLNRRTGRRVERISEAAMACLLNYDWPGNVRELENCLERAFIVCRAPQLLPAHLPAEVRGGTPLPPGLSTPPRFDAESLLRALDQTDWNVTKAAKLLGISRNTLYRRIRVLRLSRPQP